MHFKLKSEISSDYKSNNAIIKFVGNICELFDGGTILYDKRNTIKSFVISDETNTPTEIIVKRYKKSDFFKQFIYAFFRESKAKRAYYNARELKRRQIQTPEAIAYTEVFDKDLFKWGYYISRADYSNPIEDKLIIPTVFDEQLAHDFAYFVAKLHEKGILHHDLNSTNVLYSTDEGSNYTFSVIDINRMTFLPEGEKPSKNQCFDNLTRFTGRIDLFSAVIKYYALARGWNVEQTLTDAVQIKTKHDLNWKRRKSFFRFFKKKKTL